MKLTFLYDNGRKFTAKNVKELDLDDSEIRINYVVKQKVARGVVADTQYSIDTYDLAALMIEEENVTTFLKYKDCALIPKGMKTFKKR